MEGPQLWIVAGPNGAGKTTCVQKEPIQSLIQDVVFLNPDDRTLTKIKAQGFQGFADAPMDIQTRLFIESADEVFSELQYHIASRRPVGVETVLSSDKYRVLVERVVEAQGSIGLIYVALATPAIARQRIADRVRRGGHGIPEDRIEKRWRRSLSNLSWFAEHATAFWVLDNSDSDPAHAPELLATGKLGVLEFLNDAAFAEMKEALKTMPTN